jgi:hypothetical protein
MVFVINPFPVGAGKTNSISRWISNFYTQYRFYISNDVIKYCERLMRLPRIREFFQPNLSLGLTVKWFEPGEIDTLDTAIRTYYSTLKDTRNTQRATNYWISPEGHIDRYHPSLRLGGNFGIYSHSPSSDWFWHTNNIEAIMQENAKKVLSLLRSQNAHIEAGTKVQAALMRSSGSNGMSFHADFTPFTAITPTSRTGYWEKANDELIFTSQRNLKNITPVPGKRYTRHLPYTVGQTIIFKRNNNRPVLHGVTAHPTSATKSDAVNWRNNLIQFIESA